MTRLCNSKTSLANEMGQFRCAGNLNSFQSQSQAWDVSGKRVLRTLRSKKRNLKPFDNRFHCHARLLFSAAVWGAETSGASARVTLNANAIDFEDFRRRQYNY